MKLFLTFLSLLGLLLSCNSNAEKDGSVIADSVQITDTSGAQTERALLIGELNRLKAVLASAEKEKIAGIFRFPVPDSCLQIYTGDSSFNAELRQNNGSLTKGMFLRFYDLIHTNLMIDDVNSLFRYVKPDSLKQKDTLVYNVHIKHEPCYKAYGIEISGNMVSLSLRQEVNREYQNPSAAEDEIPKNSSEYCEWVLWWVFRFDGKQLQLVKIHGAG